MRAALHRGLARKPPYLFRVLTLLVAGTLLLHFVHLSSASSPAPSRVPAHQLFEALARAVVAAGAELVLLQGSTGGVALSTGAYPDGRPERHTVADQASAAVLRRVALGFPGLAVVNEEEVAAGGGGAGQGWAATREGDAGGAAAGVGAAASLAAGSAQRSPTLPLPELAVFVDPLDATQEYSEGLWEYVTVSACLTRCGVPIAGLIYQPFQQRLYWTRPGTAVNVAFSADGAVEAERALPHTWEEEGQTGGQCCRQRRQQQQQSWSALDANATAGLRLVMSRSHSQKGSTAAILASLPPDATATPAGGAGYKFIQVLEGSADAYLHPGGSRKWDVCAGEALLLAAGGSVSQWGGGATDYCLPPLPPAHLGGQAARQQAMDSAVRIAGLVAAKSGQLGQALVGLLGGSSGVPAAQVQ